jgi:sarcosine oxidase
LRAATARYFPAANGPTMALRTCMFTNTPDEHFIIDLLPEYPQIVVASPCSGHGFKFASVIGEILADLAQSGETSHDVDLLRLHRFAEKSISAS